MNEHIEKHRVARADARRLEAQIRSALNIRPGSPLPAERLHQATFPTRSRRPEMVDLPGPSSARPTAAQTLSQVVEQPQPAPAPSRAVLTDAALVEMHREAQAALPSRGSRTGDQMRVLKWVRLLIG